MVDEKDVVTAVAGASAALAGFGLVFLGLLVTTYQSFPADTPKRVLSRYRAAAFAVLVAFGIGIASMASAVLWLITAGDFQCLYIAAVIIFGLQIVAVLASTAWTVKRIVWDD